MDNDNLSGSVNFVYFYSDFDTELMELILLLCWVGLERGSLWICFGTFLIIEIKIK